MVVVVFSLWKSQLTPLHLDLHFCYIAKLGLRYWFFWDYQKRKKNSFFSCIFHSFKGFNPIIRSKKFIFK